MLYVGQCGNEACACVAVNRHLTYVRTVDDSTVRLFVKRLIGRNIFAFAQKYRK